MIELRFRKQLGALGLDVDVELPAQGISALFGRSGAGKTSLVNAVAGIVTPDDGIIRVGDQVFFDRARGIDLPLEQRGIGYVFQDARLFPHLDVAGNLRYGLKRTRGAPAVDWESVIDVLGLAHLLDRRPHHLSGGERQRVALGRALLRQPALLLMDEPLASLDAPRKAEVLPYLDGLRRRLGIPVVYVTHSLDEVMRLADTLALVDDGRIAACGPVGEVTARVDLGPLVGRFEAGTALDTLVAGHDAEFALSRLAFAGGELVVPAVDAPEGTALRVLVRARDVMLATRPPVAISARNVFAGTVSDISLEPGAHAEVAVAIGDVRLRARITRAAAAELGLATGVPVHAIVKSVAVGRPTVHP